MSKNPPMSDAQFIVFHGVIIGKFAGVDPNSIVAEPLRQGDPTIAAGPILTGLLDLKWVKYCNECQDPHPTPLGLRVYADELDRRSDRHEEGRSIQPPPSRTDPRVPVDLFASGGGFVATVMILPFNESPEVLLWGARVFTKAKDNDLTVAIPIRAQYREAFTAIAASA